MSLDQSSGARILRDARDAHDPRRLDVLHLRRASATSRPRRAASSPTTRAASRASCSRSTASGRCCSRRARSSTSRPRSTSATRSPGGLPQDALSIARERFVGDGMQDRSSIRERVDGAAAFESGSSSAPTSRTSSRSRSTTSRSAIPSSREPLPPPVPRALRRRRRTSSSSRSRVRRRRDAGAALAARARSTARVVRFAVELAPRERWELRVDVVPVARTGDAAAPQCRRAPLRRRARARARLARRLAPARAAGATPSWDDARAGVRAVGQRPRRAAHARATTASASCPPPGMPWFMTVFGRDTLITCLQTLLFGPELARAPLARSPRSSRSEDDPSIDAEPGKIVHEVRRGKAAENGSRATTAPSTRRRCTSSCSRRSGAGRTTRRSSSELREPALARARVDRPLGRPRRRRLRRVRAARAARARVQSWKDSGDSQRFHDGTLATGPIAPCEVQGYVYDAKLRTRRARARASGATAPLADRLDARGRRAPAALRRGVLGRGARRLLRARARRREAAGRLALLEHRAPALERDRARRSASRRSSTS